MIRVLVLSALFASTALKAQWCFSGPDQIAGSDYPFGIRSADFNNDSFPDLAVGRYFVSEFDIYLNDGTGGFPSGNTFTATGGFWVRHAIPGDFNSDSICDLLVIGRGSGNMAIFNGDGVGSFTQATSEDGGYDLYAGVTGHFDNDATLDWAVIDITNNNLSVFLGDGMNGHWYNFTYNLGGMGPMGIKAADVNNDLVTDFVIACNGNVNGLNKGIDVYLGIGNGTFTGTHYPLSYSASDVELTDLNIDGVPDLVIGRNGPLVIVNGNGNGTFSFPGTTVPNVFGTYLCSDDVDEDGIPDVLSSGGVITWCRGDGQGGLDSVFSYSSGSHKMATIADFDNDSRKDFASVETFAYSTDVFINCFDVSINGDNNLASSIAVSPNPIADVTSVSSSSFSGSSGNFVRIYDTGGRIVAEFVRPPLADKTTIIDISGLAQGVYTLEAGSELASSRTPVIKTTR